MENKRNESMYVVTRKGGPYECPRLKKGDKEFFIRNRIDDDERVASLLAYINKLEREVKELEHEVGELEHELGKSPLRRWAERFFDDDEEEEDEE